VFRLRNDHHIVLSATMITCLRVLSLSFSQMVIRKFLNALCSEIDKRPLWKVGMLEVVG